MRHIIAGQRKNSVIRGLAILSTLFVGLSGIASNACAALPDTLMVKVTFNDFNRNSNFGAGTCGNKLGMVQDTLDKDRKPVLKTVSCYNDHLNLWFRPSGGAGAVFDPVRNAWNGLVPYQSRTSEWIGSAFVPYPADSFANVVIYDSLPFILIDPVKGMYKFERPLQNEFWWIDNRGFGNNSTHNEFFTMEIHIKFKYTGGETFRFEGDDDVWVFINGKLAQDIGGMNAQATQILYVDQKAAELGIQVGGICWFDFFYCERSGKQSTATITTDIIGHSVNLTAAKHHRIDHGIPAISRSMPAELTIFTVRGQTIYHNPRLTALPGSLNALIPKSSCAGICFFRLKTADGTQIIKAIANIVDIVSPGF